MNNATKCRLKKYMFSDNNNNGCEKSMHVNEGSKSEEGGNFAKNSQKLGNIKCKKIVDEYVLISARGLKQFVIHL